MKLFMAIVTTMATLIMPLKAQFESDVIKTSSGDLEMFFVGHGTLMFTVDDKVIHIDPVMREADYASMPDADLILVTHTHGDHLDITAINHLMKTGTRVVMTQACLDQLEDFKATVMRNGDTQSILGVGIEAIPAYNIQHVRSNGQPYHPKGEGNGYILTFGDTRVLIGGDTENTPEMKGIREHIHVAFLPMNLPYTMTPEMVADAVRSFKPDIVYPYHFGNTDTNELVELLKNEEGIEVRIRDF